MRTTRSNLLTSILALLVTTAITACGGGANPDANSPASATAKPASDPTMPKAPDHPESDKVTWTKDGKSCHTNDKGAGDLVASVTTIAKGCVDTSKMKMLGSATQGQGSETGTMITPIPLSAKANHCYRVFGLAQSSVTDFDIAVMDSAGKSTGEDLTDGNDAIVLETGSICFKVDDAVSVNAAVASGAGKWAVEIWSDQ
jgi:hypothetical protein